MNDEVNIPKIIHLTYKDHNIPDVWKTTISEWKKYHPDWQVWFWTDKENRELIQSHYPEYLELYDSYRYGIQRADVIRYFILHTFGGIYSDMDIQPRKSFNKLLSINKKKEVYLVKANMKCLSNCIMASKKKADFWIHVISSLKSRKQYENFYPGKHLKVMNTTGPLMVNSAYNNYNKKYKIAFLPKHLIFPEECNVCSKKPCKTKCSYVKILDGSSWCAFDTKLYIFFYCNYKLLFALFIAIILITLRVMINS
jgi:mannosyltransferase OCH1-like enzyme